jgi:serine/threonine-protein kinase
MQLAANVVIAERFRLSRQLGQGGMGSVWLATHLALDIPCAVKFIEGEIAQLPEAQARFEREAKAAAQLRSPHVVQILDHGVFQGTPYIAMELLDGEDLGKRLQRIGRMAPHDVFRVVGQVCRALTKAHGLGIVHRDLKPDNIFLVPDDDREIAKVLDFGIAKATGSGIDGSNTKTGAMLGTPYYMSPEQAQGIKAVDHRSDLWSLAVIVFQALTGRLPFESEALGDLLVRIIVAPVPMPSQFVSDLPPMFDRWWERASQRDPAARFQSARELGDALAVSFGQSQGLSGEGRHQAMSDPGTGNYPAAGGGPFGNTPNPAFWNTPNPAFGNTPNPAFGSGPRTPQPYNGTQPLPAMGPTTGASMSRTFDLPSPRPQKGKGMMLAIGGAAFVVLALAIVGVSFALKGKETPSAPALTGAAASTPPAATTAAAPPPPIPAAPPQASASAVIVAASATVAAPAPPPPPSVRPAHAVAQPARPVVVPATPPPPAKKAKVDLGI